MSGGGGGGSSSSSTVIDDLSDHALDEILVRLPSQSVLRCRAVCKRWRRITSDASFLTAHAARQPRHVIIETNFHQTLSTLLSLDADYSMNRKKLLCDFTQPPDKGTGKLVCSLDGLLLIKQRVGLYIICNPATRQWTNLPRLTPDPCFTALPCAFYRHYDSSYRLLCIGLENDAMEKVRTARLRKQAYYILQAGAARPRRLCAAPRTPNPHILSGYDWYPVCYRGILHWFSRHPESNTTSKILTFHTSSETFRHMSRPPSHRQLRAGEDDDRVLLELHEELCVMDVIQEEGNNTSLHIWALQDYGSEHWMLRQRLEFPPLPTSAPRLNAALDLGQGAILTGSPSNTVLMLYHLTKEDKKVVCTEITLGYALFPSFRLFSESLVQHAFFHESPPCPDLATITFFDNYLL